MPYSRRDAGPLAAPSQEADDERSYAALVKNLRLNIW